MEGRTLGSVLGLLEVRIRKMCTVFKQCTPVLVFFLLHVCKRTGLIEQCPQGVISWGIFSLPRQLESFLCYQEMCLVLLITIPVLGVLEGLLNYLLTCVEAG